MLSKYLMNSNLNNFATRKEACDFLSIVCCWLRQNNSIPFNFMNFVSIARNETQSTHHRWEFRLCHHCTLQLPLHRYFLWQLFNQFLRISKQYYFKIVVLRIVHWVDWLCFLLYPHTSIFLSLCCSLALSNSFYAGERESPVYCRLLPESMCTMSHWQSA